MTSSNHKYPVQAASTTEALPMSPSMGPALQAANVQVRSSLVDYRVLYISLLSIILAILAALVARGLSWLIGLITNFCFFGRFGTTIAAPVGNHLGWWVVAIPVAGGIIVGLMARYGSTGIRGHGIPEAMERVLLHESRVPARLTFLKPLSAAIAIGTGGPFGAEGPIIATGGAMGSLIGQLLSVTALERKTLLSAGAAAGMAATFGTPVSAVLLAVELLLFEFRPRSFIPVALASTVAAGARFVLHMPYPVFDLPKLSQPSMAALGLYVAIGTIVGLASVVVTRAVYLVEDLFDHLPIHWMWWPALGAIPVGIIGYYQARTLGVGYENITDTLMGHLALGAVAALCALKFLSWVIALGSGTSGGTLAPLFTIGGGLGFVLGAGAAKLFPASHVIAPVGALVGMAAMFAGASRGLLTSVVFAFETTLQPLGLLPLLGGCTSAYFVSCLLMQNTIMTEKIARRGVKVPAEYLSDFMTYLHVGEIASRPIITVSENDTMDSVRQKIHSGKDQWSHQGYPVVNDKGNLVGVLTRREFFDESIDGAVKLGTLILRPAVTVYPDVTLRDAAYHMVNHDVGRLVVVQSNHPEKPDGIITRGDLLRAQQRSLDEMKRAKATLSWRGKAR